ncbi:MAG: 3'-5' exonuclease [Myxococcota bacterium]
MSGIPPIVADELDLLDDVRARLGRAGPPETADEELIIEGLRRIQEDIRTAKTEDKAALEQQYEHQCRLLEQIRRGKTDGAVDPESPYFAHLRLRQEGRVSDVMLGRATCLDHGLRIVDWRHAPVARVYYRYREGDEYEEDLGHRSIEGTVLARRTVSVSHGRLDRVDAPQGRFLRHGDTWTTHEHVSPRLAPTDGAVRRDTRDARLGHGEALRADKHLPDIAALIDPAQFELITSPDSGPVVIRGGAGSGKTTVALHRIAWLAYANPQRFAPHRMLVVVWGRALRDYVSKVLPNLGVNGVGVVTWSEWSRKLVERHFPGLPGHDNANTPSVVSRMKLHPKLPSLLERLVRSRKAPPTGDSAFEDWRLLVSDREVFRELGFSPAEIDTLANHTREQLGQLSLRLEERDRTAEPWLDEEDDAVLLRAWQLRVGELKAKGGGQVRFTHVAVDEVQDFSAMEVAVLLGATDTRKCITLAGDTQQHILAEGGSTDWGDLLGALGIPATSLSSLKVSYRSTAEITGFARRILGALAEDEAPPVTMRQGEPVSVFSFPEHGACVAFLGQAVRDLLHAQPLASIAVIAPDAATARLYFDGLGHSDVPLLRLVEDQTFAFAPGVDVVDVGQVKGLEFDYVILVDVSASSWPDRPYARRRLHVAATRAIHQLWVTYVGRPSPLLGDLA